jgi:hypothetical protein
MYVPASSKKGYFARSSFPKMILNTINLNHYQNKTTS